MSSELSHTAGKKRPKTGGKGLDGVTLKGEHYFNPFVELMKGKK